MTAPIAGQALAERLEGRFPGLVVDYNATDVWVKREAMAELAAFLRDEPGLDFNYLSSVSGVDYVDHFEVVYHLVSMVHNHSAVIKVRCSGREEPWVPSVVQVWQGADFQEREVWDLMGIRFEGHPNLKRIMLWEGFEGHPLRKDYMMEHY